MKKEAVKKWIKGFFPARQGKPLQTTNIQVSKVYKKQQNWTEAEAEIVNHLINMDSLLKIAKHLNEYEYATLYTINQVMCQQSINLDEARKALLGGMQAITDSKNGEREIKYITKQLPYQYYSVRSLLWKICLGYLVANSKEKWVSCMERNLALYRKFVWQFIVQPIEKKLGISGTSKSPESRKQAPNEDKQEKWKEKQQKNEKQEKEQKVKDHPLNFSQESKWGNYFKDVQLWSTIEKDTKRTRKNCKFFEQPHEIQLENDQISIKASLITFSPESRPQTYADSLTRIIFIYLKNHPGEHYCQGMNEIAALIYYCFTNKNSQYFRRVSQSDSYFIFEAIMGRLPKRHFQKGEEYVKDFVNLMRKTDLRLYEEIQKAKGADMMKLVAMRWFLSGFLTEFGIDECLLVWDAFVAWPKDQHLLTECFTYMALSLVHLNRQRVLEGENIAAIFGKIGNSCTEVVEKTQSLYKLFPKLLQK